MKRLIILRYVKSGLQGFLNFFRKKPISGAKPSKSGIKIVLSETNFDKNSPKYKYSKEEVKELFKKYEYLFND